MASPVTPRSFIHSRNHCRRTLNTKTPPSSHLNLTPTSRRSCNSIMPATPPIGTPTSANNMHPNASPSGSLLENNFGGYPDESTATTSHGDSPLNHQSPDDELYISHNHTPSYQQHQTHSSSNLSYNDIVSIVQELQATLKSVTDRQEAADEMQHSLATQITTLEEEVKDLSINIGMLTGADDTTK